MIRLFFQTMMMCLVISSAAFGAILNQPSSFINTPIAEPFEIGEFVYGSSAGFNNLEKSEFDFMMNYSLTNRIKFGVTFLNSTNFVGNIHCNVYQSRHKSFLVATGLLNMSANQKVSSWDGYPIQSSNNFSPYIVMSRHFNRSGFSVGYGKKKFEYGLPGVAQKSSAPGVFGGIYIPFFGSSFLYEFDGRNYNAG